MAVLFSDGFGGSDNPLSGDWETLRAGGLKEDGLGHAIGTQNYNYPSISGVKASSVSFPDDQYAEITLSTNLPTDYPGVFIRGTLDGSSLFEGYMVYTQYTKYRLYRYDGGSANYLGDTTSGPSTDDVIRIEGQGTSIKVYVNDVEEISVTDSTYSSGQPGVMYAWGNVNQTLIDSFEAGNFGIILTADTASYSLSGTDITTTYASGPGGNISMPADTRAFPIAFTDATLSYDSILSEYANTWFNSEWWARPFWGDGTWWASADEVLAADSTAYTLTGDDVTLSRTIASPVLTADPSSYAIDFIDATLTYVPASVTDITLTADPASYSITGTDINFLIAAWVEQATVTGMWTIKY